ncbi:MAG: GNAT family N-acetyltransferase [Caulobacteraceae bacterium]
MIVCRIQPTDTAQLAAVHAVAFEAPWDEATLTVLLAAPGVVALAAGVSPSVDGFILCRVAADEAEILTLAVDPLHRREGVAVALLETAMEAVRALGATSLFLEVAADNVPAAGLYAKGGFTAVGVRSGYYARAGGAVDALILRRDLNR